MIAIPRVCTVCGRRAVPGTSRCEFHPWTRPPEAVRRVREPWREGYRDPAYRRARELRLALAGGRCEACGRPLREGHWHAHHVVPLRLGGRNEPANLRVLCDSCHTLVTTRDRRRERGIR